MRWQPAPAPLRSAASGCCWRRQTPWHRCLPAPCPLPCPALPRLACLACACLGPGQCMQHHAVCCVVQPARRHQHDTCSMHASLHTCCVQEALLSPEEVGAQAAAAVKGTITATLSAAAVQREQRAAEAAREQQFPSLAAVAPPPRPRAPPAPPAAPPAQPAFSDDEDGQQGPAGRRNRQPQTAAVPIARGSGGQAHGRGSPAAAASPGPASAATAAPLSSSVKSTGGGLLGSSPAADAASAALSGGGGPGGSDYFFYQSEGGCCLCVVIA
jgi:hypothetical protein